jgi:RimJ/RimL family protein N-acetyltransferase
MNQLESATVERAIADLKTGNMAIEFAGGRLETITLATDHVVRLLAAWRDAHADGFTTRFPVTDDGTRTWLQRDVIDNPSRVLFLLVDTAGRPLGSVGFMAGGAVALPVEIDHVLRGEPAPPGFMAQALQALLDWLNDHVGRQPVGLRVLASNPRALRYYGKCGFHEVGRINLVEHRDGQRVSLVPGDEGVVDQYVTMARDPKNRRTPDDVESP